MAGGKGVNVARALKRLGQPVVATGLAGGPTGTRIVQQLTDESILNDFVRIRDESRTNTAVTDPTTGEETEINERGPAVSAHEIETFCDKLLYLARGAQIAVFAGSLPRHVEPDIYARLIRELRKLGLSTIVDTDGDPMHQAVRAEPTVVSPNVLEAEELVGHEFNDDEDRLIAVREMCELGAREAIMTADDGCFAKVQEDGSARLYRLRTGRSSRVRPSARRRLPRRLRRRPLHRVAAGRVPALRRRLRQGVHPAHRCRRHRPARGREADGRDRGRTAADPRRGQLTAGALRRWRRFPHVAVLTSERRYDTAALVRIGSYSGMEGDRPRQGHGGPTGSTTSRSCPRAARATPTTSTSPGSSGTIASTCRCWPRPWTGSSRPTWPARSAASAGRPQPRGHLDPLRGRRRAARAHRRAAA